MSTPWTPPAPRRADPPPPAAGGAGGARGARGDWIGPIAVLLALIAVTAVVSAVFWPGHMNDDTVDVYHQAAAFQYADWHSAIWTAIWSALQVAGAKSPGWMLAVGVLMLLAGLYLLLRARLPRVWALVVATLVLAFPPVLTFAVVVGTDVWFAAPLLCGFGFAIRCAHTRGAARMASAAAAVVLAVLAMAARPTAAPPVLALLCGIALVTIGSRLRGWRRALTAAGAGAVAAVLVLGSVLAVEHFVLDTTQWHPEQETYLYDLVNLSIRERQVLFPADIYPKQDLHYLTVYGVDGRGETNIARLLWGPYAVIPPVVEGQRLDDLQNAWIAAIRQHPYGYLQTRLHGGLWQLGVSGPEDASWYGPPPTYYKVGPVLLPTVQNQIDTYAELGTRPDSSGGPLQTAWVYLIVLVVAAGYLFSRRRGNPVLGLLGVALLLYTAEILVLSPATTYRYVWPAVTGATVLAPILAIDVAGWTWRRVVRRPARAAPAPAADQLDRESAPLTRQSE